jgi:hypothetical protein
MKTAANDFNLAFVKDLVTPPEIDSSKRDSVTNRHIKNLTGFCTKCTSDSLRRPLVPNAAYKCNRCGHLMQTPGTTSSGMSNATIAAMLFKAGMSVRIVS